MNFRSEPSTVRKKILKTLLNKNQYIFWQVKYFFEIKLN